MEEFINLTDIAIRIKEIQERSGLNAAEFCKRTDLSTSSFSQIISGKQKVNVDTINKMVLYWGEEYNPMWLLFGEVRDTPISASTREQDSSPSDSALAGELIRQAEEIGRLKEALSNSKPKEIKRITVFYTDNSFANYKLEQ